MVKCVIKRVDRVEISKRSMKEYGDAVWSSNGNYDFAEIN